MATVFLLVVLFILTVQLGPVQNFLKDKTVVYLQHKLNTRVAIGHISIIYPKDISIEDIFIADHEGDTLLESKKLSLNLNLPALIHSQIIIRSVNITGLKSHISRKDPYSDFNFSFIGKAFSSKTQVASKPDSSSLRISLGEIDLNKINFSFQDTVTGYHARLSFLKLHTHVEQFDLQHMAFNLSSLLLSGLDAHVRQETPDTSASRNLKPAQTTTRSPGVKIKLNSVQLLTDTVDFNSQNLKLSTSAKIGLMQINNLLLDLDKQKLQVSVLNLTNTKTLFKFLEAPKNKDSLGRAITKLNKKSKQIIRAIQKNLDSSSKSASTQGKISNRSTVSLQDSSGWKVDITTIKIKNNQFDFDNQNNRPIKNGIDYSHLALSQLTINANKIHYEPAFIKVNLDELVLKDRSGFFLKHAKGSIYFDDHRTDADQVKIETANSNISTSIKLRYNSLKNISRDIASLKLETQIKPGYIGLKDILYFQPNLRKTYPFNNGFLQRIAVRGSARGSVNNLVIKDFEASTLAETHLLVSGTLRGLPAINKLVFDIHLQDFSTSKTDIERLIPKNTIPVSVILPEHIKVNSMFSGNLKNINFLTALQTSLGNINARGMMRINSAAKDTSYQVNLQARNLQAGKLGSNKELGLISLTANVNGRGLSLNTANTTIQGQVDLAQYRGYSYQHLSLSASIASKKIQLIAAMPDPNLSFKLTGGADLSQKIHSLHLQLKLDSSNFKALHFSKNTLRLHGMLKANIPRLDVDHPSGDLKVSDLLLITDSASIPIDSIDFSVHTAGEVKTISLRSEFIKADINGQLSLPDITSQLTQQVNKYYPFTARKTFIKEKPADFQFNAVILGPPALHKFIPKLASFNPVILKGSYNSLQERLILDVSALHTQYADISIDNLKLTLDGNNTRLAYALSVDSISGSGFDLESTQVTGFASDGTLHTTLNIEDDNKKPKYQLGAIIHEHLGNYQFQLIPEGLLINYQPWKVATDNLLQYGKSGILAHHLELSNDKSSIEVKSIPNQPNAPVQINFRHFDLATVSKFLEKDSVLIRGELNGNALVDNLMNSPVFTSNLVITDFSYKKDTLGTIGLSVNNKIKNTYSAKVTIQGHGNEVNLQGDYDTGNSSFDADLTIKELTLPSLQVYLASQISHGKGYLDGQLHLSGTLSKPLITGGVGFKKIGFNLTYLNSYFTSPDQKIMFDLKGIHFNDFTLLDSAKNQLNLDGDILTQNYRDYTFDLNLSSEDFRILNSQPSSFAPFYGTVYLNSDIDITGNLDKPKIDADITLNNKTKFTYAIPADDPSLKESNGIVIFINKKETVMKGPAKKLRTSAFKGFDFSANLNVQKDAEFTVIIDPQTGDALKVKGEATLNTTIDASGKISLTGRYEIAEGSYQLSLNNFIKKSFKIQKGSTIVWTGEPTSANVDITAIYQANAPAIDLMDQQSDASTSAKYKQLLPFQLYLIMNGELLKPVITFRISLPERERNLNPDVQAQLDVLRQDPSELNKQVFALLVLGRFVGQNPFQSAAGGGLDAGLIARQSAGKIMSQQLNKIAGNLIKGVDLNFDVNSQNNYSSGAKTTQTDLKIGATKSFNDRLSVSVGSDIALEGSQSQTSTSTLIGDVSVEYKLSRDGRYRLRAFRRNATQEYVEGQFIETGISFLFVLDYDKFIEIFKARKQEKFIKPLKP